CKDIKQIERLLDGLLDFANDEKMLALFRKLCRYYYDISPIGASDYVYIYKKMWDADEVLFKSGYFKNNPIK
ncbi:MAG: hypothetical protein LBT50_06265, partial [Prevotellaceae bacterium]|nr:hypothetical protein [Prevotellaceae bacterium]